MRKSVMSFKKVYDSKEQKNGTEGTKMYEFCPTFLKQKAREIVLILVRDETCYSNRFRNR